MNLRLNIVARARIDAQRIYDWIHERSPTGADAWYAALKNAANRLLDNPTGCALAFEDELVNYEVRQFLFKTRRGRTYRGLFTVIDEEVRILRIRGPGQRDLTADELDRTD